MLDRELVVAAARECRGVKYQIRGRDPSRALDCLGLVFHALQQGGWEPRNPREILRTNYSRLPRTPDELMAAIYDEGYQVALEDVIPGDVLVLRWRSDVSPHHLALVSQVIEDWGLDGIYMIHAQNATNCVAEHRMDEGWRERLVCAVRVFD